MPYTYYTTNKVIDHVNGKTSFSMPTVYVGLSSTTPTLAGANITEPSTGGYSRVATSGATWNASVNGTTTNAAAITFPTATADWLAAANLIYGVLYDADIGGNCLGYGVLSVPKNAITGDTLSIAIGGITISLA